MTAPSSTVTKATRPNIQQKSLNSKVILFNADHFSEPTAEYFTNQYWQSKDAITGQTKGRGTTYFFRHNNNQYVLRHYHRGGLIGKILNDQYLYTGLEQSRAWQEFRLLQHMRSLNLACPTPVAALISKNAWYYQADIISVKIPNAEDLHHILLNKPLAAVIWQKVGQTIAHFHNHQIYHHDLNIHNIMLDNQSNVWLIDFDKCAIKQGELWKKANLERLKRSIEKEKRLNGILWQMDDWQILLSAYGQASKSN